MSEYIGSRISLISKSDIKYIGTLHEINSESHTVALESVTSFGTEGRRGNPADEVPGSDQVYEYIVFRGSDVKELTIVAPPAAPKENERPKMPDDPAILGSARPAPQNQPPPPQQHDQSQFRGPQPPQQSHPQFGYQGPPNQFQAQPRFQGPGGPHGFPGAPGAVPAYGYGPPPPGYGMPYGPPPGQGFPPQGAFSPGPQMPYGPPGQQMQEMPGSSQAATGSNRATPQPAGQPSQTPAQQPQPPTKPSAAPTGPAAAQKAAAATPQAPQAPQVKAAQRAGPRVAVPLPSPNVLAAKPPQRPAAQAPSAPPSGAQPQSTQDATRAATAAVASAMAKLGNASQPRQQPDGVDNLAQKVNQMRVQDGQQYRGRGRGRGSTPAWGGRREGGLAAVEVPKEDFDFASSNAKFNKQDLIKEAIATGEPIASPEAEKAGEPIAATNGHVFGDAADDVVIPPPKAEKGYNKKSSFFDDISSDLKDRVVQAEQQITIDGRAIRREERTKNVETFGQGSVDTGARGGYRGRGRGGRGFRGGAPGGGYRGRGGFEARGGFRGRGRVEADAI